MTAASAPDDPMENVVPEAAIFRIAGGGVPKVQTIDRSLATVMESGFTVERMSPVQEVNKEPESASAVSSTVAPGWTSVSGQELRTVPLPFTDKTIEHGEGFPGKDTVQERYCRMRIPAVTAASELRRIRFENIVETTFFSVMGCHPGLILSIPGWKNITDIGCIQQAQSDQ